MYSGEAAAHLLSSSAQCSDLMKGWNYDKRCKCTAGVVPCSRSLHLTPTLNLVGRCSDLMKGLG